MDITSLSLVFINRIGKSLDGRYEYTLYYSDEPENVWAEDYSEQVPSVCKIESLIPEEGTYNFTRKATSTNNIHLAQDNSCFSFQDCIDGIIQLAWAYDMNGGFYYGIPYGSDVEMSDLFLEKAGMTLGDFKEINKDKENEDEPDGGTRDVVFKDVDYNDAEPFTDEEVNVKQNSGEEDDDYLERLFNGEV